MQIQVFERNGDARPILTTTDIALEGVQLALHALGIPFPNSQYQVVAIDAPQSEVRIQSGEATFIVSTNEMLHPNPGVIFETMPVAANTHWADWLFNTLQNAFRSPLYKLEVRHFSTEKVDRTLPSEITGVVKVD